MRPKIRPDNGSIRTNGETANTNKRFHHYEDSKKKNQRQGREKYKERKYSTKKKTPIDNSKV